jgi:dissimilatory sulfite reductase (desulfoviridin) alpha/beta subunit
MVQKIFDYYQNNASSKERMPRFVERVGIDEIIKALGVQNG